MDKYCDYDIIINKDNITDKEIRKMIKNSKCKIIKVKCTNYYEGKEDLINDYIKSIENNPIALRQIYEGLMNFDYKSILEDK